MPGLFGGLLSILMAGLASPETYDNFSSGVAEADKGLYEVFPALMEGSTASGQALSQGLAMLVTLAFAIVGGLLTGMVMKGVGKMEGMDQEDFYNDDWNVDEMEEKEELPEELKSL